MSLYDDSLWIITPNQYASGSLYALKPVDGSGDLFVDRSSYANRVNSSGLLEYMSENVPRLDYSNGSCPEILIEPQRTNIALYSEKLINGYAFSYTSGTFIVSENTTNTFDPAGILVANSSTAVSPEEITSSPIARTQRRGRPLGGAGQAHGFDRLHTLHDFWHQPQYFGWAVHQPQAPTCCVVDEFFCA